MNTCLVLCLILLISACSSWQKVVIPEQKDPHTITVSSAGESLRSLPEIKQKIPVAIYSFRDQTGQYKSKETLSTFSTAVTQGATSILIQSLLDSDWFIPVEREGLQDILTERKIHRASIGKIAKQPNQSSASLVGELSVLTPAPVVIDGGIISYDSNIKTGGKGAEYFGIGTSDQYREDQLSVYLRLVDVNTGQVLLSVSASKTILSYQVRAGVFKFISYKRLLEAEAGYTVNEPTHIGVQQAIEFALVQLVKKGIALEVWKRYQKA